MQITGGVFTISLDFELYWGIRDRICIDEYKENLLGVRTVIPKILSLFNAHSIHATWATVGLIFLDKFSQIELSLPELLPTYKNQSLSPYDYLKNYDKLDPIYHFAPDMIKLINKTIGQEIGTHTFSHYYCLEDGQTVEQFEADLLVAIKVAKMTGIQLKSIVFPRNQCNMTYLTTLAKAGIFCYRGDNIGWAYGGPYYFVPNLIKRAFRLCDTFINISGFHTYEILSSSCGQPYNIPASRFLRPYSKRTSCLERFKINRILKEMTHAAINNQLYHLWWHPHNFGVDIEKNMMNLGKIIQHYEHLKNQYNMSSLNMKELHQLVSV